MIGVNEHRVPSMVEMRQWARFGPMVLWRIAPGGHNFLRREDHPTVVFRRYADGVVLHVSDPPTRS